MISGSLIYSGIVVGTFLVIIFICWFSFFMYKYHQLQKFKVKGGSVLEQEHVYYSVISLFALSLAIYLVAIILGIVFLVGEAQNNASLTTRSIGLSFEIMFLIYIVFIFVFLVILLIYQNTIILVFKNETLLTMNAIVDVKSILQIRRDNKRRWIFINWKDNKEKRVREIKLKYTYKVKDYLKSNGLWQEQEPIE